MRKLKEWIIARFLPVWAKESVYKENQRLRAQIEQQQHEIDRLTAYTGGIEYALRRGVTIRNEVKQ